MEFLRSMLLKVKRFLSAKKLGLSLKESKTRLSETSSPLWDLNQVLESSMTLALQRGSLACVWLLRVTKPPKIWLLKKEWPLRFTQAKQPPLLSQHPNLAQVRHLCRKRATLRKKINPLTEKRNHTPTARNANGSLHLPRMKIFQTVARKLNKPLSKRLRKKERRQLLLLEK